MIGPIREPKAASWKTRLIASLFFLIMRALSRTYRVRISGERSVIVGLPERDEAVVLALWHNRLFYFATYLHRFLLRQGFRLALLASDSRDGEIAAQIGKKAGAAVVRGSSSSRGAAGLRALYRAMVKDKQSIIILPDGSQGPIYKAKAGAVTLAKMTGAPVVPMSWWANRYWRIGSWDRMIIPKPFAQIELTVGEPIYVAREADDAALEAKRSQLERELDQLGFRAEEAFASSSDASGPARA